MGIPEANTDILLPENENETNESLVITGTLKVRRGSRTAATSKMEYFVIIVNGFQPLTIITKRSILDVAAVLDPPLLKVFQKRDLFKSFPKDHAITNSMLEKCTVVIISVL